MERVAIVEFGGSHDECILSQLIALKQRGCHITFVCTKSLHLRTPYFNEYLNEVLYVDLLGAALGDFKEMIRLNRFFSTNGISKVILNTAQGGHVRNLCLTASPNVEFIGIIHTLKKFQNSFTQRLIDFRVKKYLVLNDYFLDKIKDKKGRFVESFYPLRFPTFSKIIAKPHDEIWITIIGGVETRRKDLMGSMELMKNSPNNIRFIFLGKSDINSIDRKSFEIEIEGSDLAERIVLFNEFVKAEDFNAYLNATDIIWPMVHPNTPSSVEYFRNQISGAINVAFAYKIPLLIHRDYANTWGDLKNSIGYDLNNFQSDLLSGISDLERLRSSLPTNQKFDPEFQEKKYIDLIFGKTD